MKRGRSTDEISLKGMERKPNHRNKRIRGGERNQIVRGPKREGCWSKRAAKKEHMDAERETGKTGFVKIGKNSKPRTMIKR